MRKIRQIMFIMLSLFRAISSEEENVRKEERIQELQREMENTLLEAEAFKQQG